jgi:hypothetical protein
MASFDKQKFAEALRKDALPPFGKSKCAHFVNMAIKAAGVNVVGVLEAKNWGPSLLHAGFVPVPAAGWQAKIGDIAVIQGTTHSTSGHMEGFDGTYWISDFVQQAFWPGPSFRAETPPYLVYRWPN